MTFFVTCETLGRSTRSCVAIPRESTSLHILGVDCRTGAHIVGRHIFVRSDCLLDRFARDVVPLHLFGRLPDSSVGSLGLIDSRQCYDFWFRRWCTRKPCHSSC